MALISTWTHKYIVHLLFTKQNSTIIFLSNLQWGGGAPKIIELYIVCLIGDKCIFMHHLLYSNN